MAYNLLVNGVCWGYNQLTNLLLTSWDVQVSFFDFSFRTNNPTSVKNSLAHRFCWGWEHTATGYLTVHGSKCGSFDLRWHHHLKIGIVWVVPPPSNSHHQDYSIFSRASQPKPSFATVTGRGDNPRHSHFIILYLLFSLSSLSCVWKCRGGILQHRHLKTCHIATFPRCRVRGWEFWIHLQMVDFPLSCWCSGGVYTFVSKTYSTFFVYLKGGDEMNDIQTCFLLMNQSMHNLFYIYHHI